MNEPDPVLTRLSALPVPALEPRLSARIQAQGAIRLTPRRVAPAWTVALALSAASYLFWALSFAGSLLAAR